MFRRSARMQSLSLFLLSLLFLSLPSSLSSLQHRCNTNRYTDSPRFGRATAAVSRVYLFHSIVFSFLVTRPDVFPTRFVIAPPHPRNLYFRYYWKSSLSPSGLDENLFPSEVRALSSPSSSLSIASAKLLYCWLCVIVALISRLILARALPRPSRFTLDRRAVEHRADCFKEDGPMVGCLRESQNATARLKKRRESEKRSLFNNSWSDRDGNSRSANVLYRVSRESASSSSKVSRSSRL